MVSKPHEPELDGAGVVHDANQMLAVIAGRVGLLLARDPEPEVRRHLRAISLACSDAGVILRRLQGVRPEISPASCRLEQEVRTALEVVRPGNGATDWEDSSAATKTGRWSCSLAIPGDVKVGVPGHVVREALANLLTNALEAMPAGGSVDLSARVETGRVLLTVADSGPGIPTEVADRLFRTRASTKGDSSRGIGLAGSRRLLASYGAGLELASSTRDGARFMLDLPCTDQVPEDFRPEPEPRPPSGIETPANEARILVVDDEETVRDMLVEVLGELGCRVTVVPDAESALAGFQAGAFQIALLDQSLPGMSGAELAKRLRANDPCLSVFLMTGWGNEDALDAPDPLTVDFTARKPMEFDRLRRLLDEAAALHARRSRSGRPQDEGRSGEQQR